VNIEKAVSCLYRMATAEGVNVEESERLVTLKKLKAWDVP